MLEEYREEILNAVNELQVGDVVLLSDLVVGWDEVPRGRRTQLGQDFRNAVIGGEFPRLINIGRNAGNHQQYERV